MWLSTTSSILFEQQIFEFRHVARIPSGIGAVDGIFVHVKGMSGLEEQAYVCRGKNHSLNIQADTDAWIRFTF